MSGDHIESDVPAPRPPAAIWLSRHWLWWAIAACVALVYGDALLLGDGTILSHRMGDASRYYVHSRPFLASEWLQGNVPLWNPHIFAGAPFAGVFQTGVFYPPNAIHLMLPHALALNLEVVLHALLMGVTTAVWVRGFGRSRSAALVAACIVTFGATFSLRVLAGQLTVLQTHAWAPLLLWAIDRQIERPALRPLLWGGLATTMMLLAGHPPTCFMMALGSGAYLAVRLARCERRVACVAGLAAMVAVSLLVAGVQLAAGLVVALDGTRQSGMSLDFATSFSYPLESLLTYLVPNLYGGADARHVDYGGRWWYWDDVAFVGLTSLTLAVWGIRAKHERAPLVAVGFVAACFVLALGGATPVFPILYEWVPGFDMLRAPSKFMVGTTFGLAWLAAAGVDRLHEIGANGDGRRDVGRRGLWGTALVWLAASIVFFVLAELARVPRLGNVLESPVLTWLAALGPGVKLGSVWSVWVVWGLQRAAFVALVLGLCFLATLRTRWAVVVVTVLCVLEIAVFARDNRGGVPYDVDASHRGEVVPLYAKAYPDRVLELNEATSFAMMAGGNSVWGYDPVVLDRSAVFMAWTQGIGVEGLDNVQGVHARAYHPALAMLRTRYTIHVADEPHRVNEHRDVLPRAFLVGRTLVRAWPEGVLDALGDRAFDPREGVVLESAPEPAPEPAGAPGRVRIVAEQAGRIDLDVDLDAAAILVVTDTWAPGWRAWSRMEGDARSYDVRPANGVLRSIALGPGHHELTLAYAPRWVAWGWAATALGLVLSAGAVGFSVLRPPPRQGVETTT